MKVMQNSSMRKQLLIEMSRFPSFQKAVYFSEIPNTKFIYEFWKRKSESLKQWAVEGEGKDALKMQFGKYVCDAIKDEYKIANYYSDMAMVHLRKAENENGGGEL